MGLFQNMTATIYRWFGGTDTEEINFDSLSPHMPEESATPSSSPPPPPPMPEQSTTPSSSPALPMTQQSATPSSSPPPPPPMPEQSTTPTSSPPPPPTMPEQSTTPSSSPPPTPTPHQPTTPSASPSLEAPKGADIEYVCDVKHVYGTRSGEVGMGPDVWNQPSTSGTCGSGNVTTANISTPANSDNPEEMITVPKQEWLRLVQEREGRQQSSAQAQAATTPVRRGRGRPRKLVNGIRSTVRAFNRVKYRLRSKKVKPSPKMKALYRLRKRKVTVTTGNNVAEGPRRSRGRPRKTPLVPTASSSIGVESRAPTERRVRHLHRCHKCHRVFATRSSLLNHRLFHMKPSGQLKCKVCGRNTFKTTNHLKQHEDSHNSVFHCCGKSFGRLSYLQAHQQCNRACTAAKPSGSGQT